MRHKERIPIFLKLVDWGKLKKRWEIGTLILDKDYESYWIKHPDQRIGQVLINLGLVRDNLMIWLDEEIDILIDQGVEPREFLLWTSYYGKDHNLLDKPITKIIKELSLDHLQNILRRRDDDKLYIDDLYLNTIKNEIKLKSNLL